MFEVLHYIATLAQISEFVGEEITYVPKTV